MSIEIAQSDESLRRISSVLLQLRPAFDTAGLIERIKEQMRSGYRVAYLETAGEVQCVAGFVIGSKLAWGKHLYVDDLVTAQSHRSEGAGAQMIAWLEAYALKHGCSQLHLDSGVQRFAAHRFYLREGFDITSHHFAITDLGKKLSGTRK